jgi:integration host factor subunit alpha
MESATLVEQVLKEIIDCLERGETVKLASFGTFLVRKRGSRPGRNPKTGEDVRITPRRVIVFKPSGMLTKRLAKPDQETKNTNDSAATGSATHQ